MLYSHISFETTTYTKEDSPVRTALLNSLNHVRTQFDYQTGITSCIGAGTTIQSPNQISVSVYQAVSAIESLHLCKRTNEVRLYENMGIYRIFFQYQNDQELIRLYQTILRKLITYDKENNSQFMETLEIDFDEPNPGFTMQLAFKIKRYLIAKNIML